MQKPIYAPGAAAVFAASLLLTASAASALEIKSGNDKVQLKLYGSLNRAVMYADDGSQDKLFHVDNSNYQSEIGLNGEIEAADFLTVGGSFAVFWDPNPAYAVSMEEETIAGEFSENLAEVYFNFQKAGKFSLGFGSMASDGSAEVDLSGTDLAGYAGVSSIGGGLAFYDAAAGKYSEFTAGSAFTGSIPSEALYLKNRVRYDTPSLAGFTLAAAAGEGETVDASLNYSGEFGGTQLAAMAAVSDSEDCVQINASASALFPFGLNFTLATAKMDMDEMPAGGDHPVFTYGKIGYKFDSLLAAGSTAFSVDYGVFENAAVADADQDGTAVGVQLVQELSEWSTQLYGAWRAFGLEDNTGTDYKDISLIMTGARFSF